MQYDDASSGKQKENVKPRSSLWLISNIVNVPDSLKPAEVHSSEIK